MEDKGWGREGLGGVQLRSRVPKLGSQPGFADPGIDKTEMASAVLIPRHESSFFPEHAPVRPGRHG